MVKIKKLLSKLWTGIKIFLLIVGVLIVIGLFPVWCWALFNQRVKQRIIIQIMLFRAKYESSKIPFPEPEPHALISDKLTEITVKNFIQCAVHGNLQALILDEDKKNPATQVQLERAWLSIIEESGEKGGAGSSKKYIDLSKEIASITLRLNWVAQMCKGLETYYHSVFIKELQKYYPGRQYTKETYLQDIEWIRTAEIRIKSILRGLEAQKEKQFPENTTKPTEESFYKTLSTILEYKKIQDFPIKVAEKMSMADFYFALNEYNTYAEAVKRQAEIDKIKNKR